MSQLGPTVSWGLLTHAHESVDVYCTELQPSIFIFFDRGYNFHRNIDKDPNYNHIPCGDPFFGGYWRSACTLPCCVVPIKDETDSEWDPDATDAETDVDTDNTEDRARVCPVPESFYIF